MNSPRYSLGILSDTHSWVHPWLLQDFAGMDAILHAGDIGDLAVLDVLAEVAPVIAVRGNIEGQIRELPLTKVVVFGGKRIGLLHIAGHPDRPNRDAVALIREHRLDVLVVGHSHIPAVGRVHGALWLNPGAAGNHGFHTERQALRLHIAGGELSLERLHLGPRGAKVVERAVV